MPVSFSDERGAGTFHSLGALPRRRHPPVFHIPHDDDADDQVPFPRAPSPPRTPSPPSSPLPRGVSAPVLVNGKPLKSSLKSSPSSPSISIPPETQRLHLRARSEPGTPAKNVHFPEKDNALATIRVFRRSARPASLSSPPSINGDETETEGEDAPPSGFPFPPMFPVRYEIDSPRSSPVPCPVSSLPQVILESLHLPSPTPSAKLSLAGSVLVANLAFEKNVAVRFTLDDWQTVSEVSAHYLDSVSILPSRILSPSTTSTPSGTSGWDRFSFTVRLDDYVHSLSTRTLWLAARFRVESTYPEPGDVQCGPGGEWWDNNRGTNYRVAFRPAVAPTFSQPRPRRETLSELKAPPRGQLQSPTTSREHASGFSIPPTSCKTTPNQADRRSIPLPTGKLCLSNYAPPTSSLAPLPLPQSHRDVSPCTITHSDVLTSAAPRAPSQSDEDVPSPVSSTLSTPSESPTMAPRVLINGHPATSMQPHRPCEDDSGTLSTRLGHIADWDWSASSEKLRNDMEGLSRQRADPNPVPGLVAPDRTRDSSTPQGRKPLGGNKSLYDAFVTHWCFAQGPSPHGYSDGGIMA